MPIKRQLRVLIIDDSLVFRETIARGLAGDNAIEVVGKATDAFDGLKKVEELHPDVLVMDVEMPRMNGIELLKRLMPTHPMPVVACSSLSSNVFDALKAGAVDFVSKPDASAGTSFQSFLSELSIKIKIASTAKLGDAKKNYVPVSRPVTSGEIQENVIVAIGASTGGTEAIFDVIKLFPRDMPGVVIVQHMPPVFTRMYAERLNNSCPMEVVEAKDGDEIRQGRVLIAPGGFQMRVRKKDSSHYCVAVEPGEKVSGHCPSVDVLFASVAAAAGRNAVGVILTGMGSDGAKGLLDMKKAGAFTVGQDESTCVVYGMPMVAYNIGGVAVQAPLGSIAKTVCDHLAKK